jgi:hypothetical protein
VPGETDFVTSGCSKCSPSCSCRAAPAPRCHDDDHNEHSEMRGRARFVEHFAKNRSAVAAGSQRKTAPSSLESPGPGHRHRARGRSYHHVPRAAGTEVGRASRGGRRPPVRRRCRPRPGRGVAGGRTDAASSAAPYRPYFPCRLKGLHAARSAVRMAVGRLPRPVGAAAAFCHARSGSDSSKLRCRGSDRVAGTRRR